MRERNPYTWPFVLIGIGLAMLIGMVAEGEGDWGWAFLPMLVGCGMLISRRHYLRQRDGKGGPANAGVNTQGSDPAQG